MPPEDPVDGGAAASAADSTGKQQEDLVVHHSAEDSFEVVAFEQNEKEQCTPVKPETLQIGCWERWVLRFQHAVLAVLHPVSQFAVRNPWITISTTTILAFGLVAIGLFTNFRIENDEYQLWTIYDSYGPRHDAYLADVARSQSAARVYQMYAILHAHGESVLDMKAIEYAFDVQEEIERNPAWVSFCEQDNSLCSINSVTVFWDDNRTIFEENIRSNEELTVALSSVPPERFRTAMGKPVLSSDGQLESLASYVFILELLRTDEGSDVLSLVEEDLLVLRSEIAIDPNNGQFFLEMSAPQGFADE